MVVQYIPIYRLDITNVFNDHQVHQLHRMYTKPIGFVEWEEKLWRPSRYSSGGDESQKKW